MIQHPLIWWKLYYPFETSVKPFDKPGFPLLRLVNYGFGVLGTAWFPLVSLAFTHSFPPPPPLGFCCRQLCTCPLFYQYAPMPPPFFFCRALWAFGILVPQPGMEPVPPGLEAQSLNLSSCGRGLSCFATYGILVRRPGIEPWIGRWILNHWTTEDVPRQNFLRVSPTLELSGGCPASVCKMNVMFWNIFYKPYKCTALCQYLLS